MQHALHPILGKARIHGLALNVATSGLCLNDPAELHISEDGQLQVRARIRRRLLGLFPRQIQRVIGHLGPRTTTILLPYLQEETPLRLRIVGLTPEYIAAPEVFVSIWGNFRPQFSGPPPLAQSA
ncbi:hypothetical protein [Gemmobacter serpentinus]|uniref:hypothetical protein n=1 Tax=Gemmobacter serpentinus TaxID=2652247 RepID=UPI00124C04F5|nr:hypothetical protein [Gemmobacter serpentinus]